MIDIIIRDRGTETTLVSSVKWHIRNNIVVVVVQIQAFYVILGKADLIHSSTSEDVHVKCSWAANLGRGSKMQIVLLANKEWHNNIHLFMVAEAKCLRSRLFYQIKLHYRI